MNRQLDLSLLSKYRDVLMGLGIIEVMIGHAFLWNCHDSLFYKILSYVYIVFTQGFLVLSGIGLYFSFKRNKSIIDFYKRRVYRLFIPYLIMSIPLVGAIMIIENSFDLVSYIGWITAIGYFIPGLQNNMWYVALIIILYIIFPLLFYILERNNYIKNAIILIAGSILIAYFIKLKYPTYFDSRCNVYYHIPSFIIGILIGKWVYQGIKLNMLYVYSILLSMMLVVKFVIDKYIGSLYFMGVYRLFLLLSLIFIINRYKTTISKTTEKCLKWFGKYTLELYVLHEMLKYIIMPISLFPIWINTIIIMILSVSICMPLNKILLKIYDKLIQK